jgi:type VI secretion system protein ImpA
MQRLGIKLVEEIPMDVEAGEGLAPDTPGAAVTVQRMVVGEIANREDALRMLDKICDYFQRYEPSSPVPFLLRRARNLATKDFMEILHDLAPGGASQADVIFGSPTQDGAH